VEFITALFFEVDEQLHTIPTLRIPVIPAT
jgi:hypothetical protein